MRVLVVEDDSALGAFLRKGLEMEGHSVEWAQDGDAALLCEAEISPDLILLDLSLPKRDGIEVLAELQARHRTAAVLVVTGRNDLQERVQCLDMGADDCLLKPFSFFELTARCRALLRRRQQFADPVLRYDDLELNRIDHKVMRAGRGIELTVREFALLEYLLLHRGECISRTELLNRVWQLHTDTGTNIVDVYVNYLRRKLEPAGAIDGQFPLITTVRGIGYLLGTPSGQKLVARPCPPPAVTTRHICA